MEVEEPVDKIKNENSEQDADITEKLAQVEMDTEKKQVEAIQNGDETEKESAKIKELLTLFDDKVIALDEKKSLEVKEAMDEVKILKGQVTNITEKLAQVEIEKAALQKQVEALQNDNEKSVQMKELLALCGDKIVKLDKRMCAFDSAGISLETSKELRDEQTNAASNVLLPFQPPATSKCKSHPSDTAISLSEAKLITALIKRASCKVSLTGMPLLYDINICCQEYSYYTHDETSDFMDMKTGIYTVPLRGRYKFEVTCKTPSYRVDVTLCLDRGKRHVNLSEKWNEYKGKGIYSNSVCLDCEVNDKIWLDAKGNSTSHGCTLNGLVFEASIEMVRRKF